MAGLEGEQRFHLEPNTRECKTYSICVTEVFFWIVDVGKSYKDRDCIILSL